MKNKAASMTASRSLTQPSAQAMHEILTLSRALQWASTWACGKIRRTSIRFRGQTEYDDCGWPAYTRLWGLFCYFAILLLL